LDDHILVWGAGGFVGQHLVRSLAQHGEQVIAINRRPMDFDDAGVEVIAAEFSAPEHFAPLLDRCRAVVHLASRSTPGSSAGRPLSELHDNLRPTLALLQAMQDRPRIELLYLSSGGSLYGDQAGTPSTESANLQPRSYHGAAKIAAEYFIDAWCGQYSGAATVVRPSNVYGPGQVEHEGFGIIPAVFGRLMRGEPLTIWGDGSAVRDYLYIDDLIALCMAVLGSPMPKGARRLNAANGAGASLNDLIAMMEEVAGLRLQRSYQSHRPVDANRIVMDCSLTAQRYGWTATTSLHEGLRQTWAWFSTTPH